MMQGRDGIKGPNVATEGGTITVTAPAGVDTIEVSVPGQPGKKSFPVGRDRTTTVPVPPVPPGTILVITAGPLDPRVNLLLVEVIGANP